MWGTTTCSIALECKLSISLSEIEASQNSPLVISPTSGNNTLRLHILTLCAAISTCSWACLLAHHVGFSKSRSACMEFSRTLYNPYIPHYDIVASMSFSMIPISPQYTIHRP